MEKIGMSAVIATVLLIFLTIVAVTIIASFIVPFVKNSFEETKCLNFREYYSFEEDFDYNCYDNDLHGLSIRAFPKDIDLSILNGFDLVFSNDGSSRKVSVREGDVESCDVDGVRNLSSNCNSFETLPLVGKGEYSVFTYVHHGGGETYNKVEIYPVIRDGGSCELSDSIRLAQCGPGVDLTP